MGHSPLRGAITAVLFLGRRHRLLATTGPPGSRRWSGPRIHALLSACAELSRSSAVLDPPSLLEFENAYLNRVLTRLFDPVHLVLPAGSHLPPSLDDVNNILKTVTAELNAVSFDGALSEAVAKNIGKTVQLFCVKAEGMSATEVGPSRLRPHGALPEPYRRNMELVNDLHLLLER